MFCNGNKIKVQAKCGVVNYFSVFNVGRVIFTSVKFGLHDRSFENQRYRASGLNLVVVVIILWNTEYTKKVVETLRKRGERVDV
ncbi:Tn3 family transposase [Photobacterium kasasachensis]|uniref:Tn3 family transposase n=1 Tax=Photobacterium kasasachensis TaxID=2910240 RepID=UPI003D096159